MPGYITQSGIRYDALSTAQDLLGCVDPKEPMSSIDLVQYAQTAALISIADSLQTLAVSAIE